MNKDYTTITVLKEVKEPIAKVLKQRRKSWTDLFAQLMPYIRDSGKSGENASRIEIIVKLVL